MDPRGTAHDPGADSRGVLALVRALADSGVDLAHNTAQMAVSEARMVLRRATIRLGLFVAGLFAAGIGLSLALVGLALVLVEIGGMEPWLAFVVVGVVTLVAGAAFAFRAASRLSDPDLAFEATLAELRDDVKMLRGERAGDGSEAP